MKKYCVKLNGEQREQLGQAVSSGKAAARTIMHAHILLKADESQTGPHWPDERIQQAFGVGAATIWRVRRRFVEQGLEDALHRRPQPERPEKRKLTGEVEAHLIALSCEEKPEGEGHWSLRLLAHKLVVLQEVEEVSYETVRRILKKTNSSRGSRSSGAFLPSTMPSLSTICRMYCASTRAPTTHASRNCAWMRSASNS